MIILLDNYAIPTDAITSVSINYFSQSVDVILIGNTVLNFRLAIPSRDENEIMRVLGEFRNKILFYVEPDKSKYIRIDVTP